MRTKMRTSIIFLLFMTSLMASFKSYGIGGGQLKVQVKELRSDTNVIGACLKLYNETCQPVFAITDSCGIAYFSRVPNGLYTLFVWDIYAGRIEYLVYVEAGELSSICCTLYNSPTYCPFTPQKTGMLGSVYGNTSLYKPDRILTIP